ncbi:dihydrofolate reductase family protein [Actinoplanes siamensis]|uniref:Pyrimidine reductase n=1 Tax=Actinoplanes siamensis TaxID=1223317 RepID=A0A919N4V4_9ACTN|nr:dihydrofolate reductase family protein [Actinoplanes siamensis]GIF04413.1 pyrimidine reductase [Actinoplanes siamensis]
MGKVVAVEYVTLDGVFEEPSWSAPYFDEELSAWQDRNLREADAMLLGRRTYEGLRTASMLKYVATTTLTTLEGNAVVFPGDLAGLGNLLITGSATLVNHLTRHNLIDEYRLMVCPVVLGEGRRLWAEGTRVALALKDSWTTATGVQVVTYVPA